MQTTDPLLFACYILYVYFNGRNLARLEREMRSLGYPRFHRRILYPRADKPGWIAKYGWNGAVGVPPAAPGNAGALACMSAASARKPAPQLPNRQAPDSGPDGFADRVKDSTSPHSYTPPTANRQPPADFPDWLRTVSPNMTWSWRHQQVIIEQLERVTRGESKRLMIFLPPRHGKSELVTVRYTAWRMQREPSMNVILGSYNQRLADRFSRKIRKVISDAESLSVPPVVTGGSNTANKQSHDNPLNTATNRAETQLASTNTIQCVSSPHVSKGPAGRESPHAAPDDSAADIPQSALRIPQSDSRRPTSRGEPSCSPFPFIFSRPANSVSEWETSAGGGFRSVGVGSGVTGFGASLIVIDDPVKSRAEAESETYRERVWDWFTDDLYTRLEPDGAIVLIQTRWHEDDLAGRLLREASEEGGEKWDVVCLPAISEAGQMRNAECGVRNEENETSSQFANETAGGPRVTPAAEIPNSAFRIPHSIDWRDRPDLPLCPERYNKQALLRIRRRLGEYSFAALYQQRPTPAEGGLFKREWFKKIIPFAPPGLKWKRGYDLAVSTKTNADYTASFRCAFDKEGNLYISGGFRGRLEYPDQRRFVIERVKAETDTEHGIELALHGQALIQDLRRERGVRGHLLRGVRVEHDKYTRALTWAPLAEEGKVFLVRDPCVSSPHGSKGSAGHPTDQPHTSPPTANVHHSSFRLPHSPNWIPDFIDEVCSFPSAAHDDQVDAVSLAVQLLKGSGKRSCGF